MLIVLTDLGKIGPKFCRVFFSEIITCHDICRRWLLHEERMGHSLEAGLEFDSLECNRLDTNSDDISGLEEYAVKSVRANVIEPLIADITNDTLADMTPGEQNLEDENNSTNPVSIDPEDTHDPDEPPDNGSNITLDDFQDEHSWHPFYSRVHCQLVLLYHGSHRKNIDLVTFKAFLTIMKTWVPADVYFPTLDEIVNFSIPFWEEKLFKETLIDDNIMHFLEPSAMISLRLGNPRHCRSFDRVPRLSYDDQGNRGLTTQSSAFKFKEIEFNKLNDYLVGDLVCMNTHEYLENVSVGSMPSNFFFQIAKFFIKEDRYYVTGLVFIHSSAPQLQDHLRMVCCLKCTYIYLPLTL